MGKGTTIMALARSEVREDVVFFYLTLGEDIVSKHKLLDLILSTFTVTL